MKEYVLKKTKSQHAGGLTIYLNFLHTVGYWCPVSFLRLADGHLYVLLYRDLPECGQKNKKILFLTNFLNDINPYLFNL